MQIGIVSFPYFLRVSIVFNYACAISLIRFITLLVLHSDVIDRDNRACNSNEMRSRE